MLQVQLLCWMVDGRPGKMTIQENKVIPNEIMNWVNPRYKNITGVVQQKNEKNDDGTVGFKIEEPYNSELSITRIFRRGKDRIKRMSKGIFP